MAQSQFPARAAGTAVNNQGATLLPMSGAGRHNIYVCVFDKSKTAPHSVKPQSQRLPTMLLVWTRQPDEQRSHDNDLFLLGTTPSGADDDQPIDLAARDCTCSRLPIDPALSAARPPASIPSSRGWQTRHWSTLQNTQPRSSLHICLLGLLRH